MTVAEVLEPLVRTTVGTSLPIRVDCWDGSTLGPREATLHLRFTSRRALRRLLWAPNELGVARAYVSGDVLVEGDLLEAMTMLEEVADPERGPGVHMGRDTTAAIARAVLRLGALGPRPRPPPRRSSSADAGIPSAGTPRRSRTTTTSATTSTRSCSVPSHRLLLRRTSSSAVRDYASRTPSAPSSTSSAASSGSAPGHAPARRRLRVGGARPARGARVRRATRSASPSRASRRLPPGPGSAEAGSPTGSRSGCRTTARSPTARTTRSRRIGMAEHVGLAELPAYAEHLHDLLAPGGRLLNHAIARRPGRRTTARSTGRRSSTGTSSPTGSSSRWRPWSTPSRPRVRGPGRRVAPGALRAHPPGVGGQPRAGVGPRGGRLSSPGRARVWRLYMAGSALAFQSNRLGVNQVLAVRPGPGGASGLPRTRPELLRRAPGT